MKSRPILTTFAAMIFTGALASVHSEPQDPFARLADPSLVPLLKSVWGKSDRMNVSPREGRYLHDLIGDNDFKAGLEIGTSNGYSSMWLGMAFRQTGGRLITIENSQVRGREAQANFEKAGLLDVIDLRVEDALKVIPSLAGPFDFVFIDAWKVDYQRYLELVLPAVRPGGIIAAHNVTDQRNTMARFIREITHNPRLETEFVPISRSGLSISRKIK